MYKSYGSNGTIREVLDAIQRRALVLPAIQREFVWRPEQICQFFDSLMQGYPFGTFLFWRVAPDKSQNFKWYDFVRDYHEKDKPHCPELGEMPNQALTAVLDGQQRLTALNIGLQGSMAWKLPRAHYRFPQNFPTRRLCLNILAKAGEEQGARYQFDFLRDDRPRDSTENDCWFKVADIRGMSSSADVMRWASDNAAPSDLSDRALETLSLLHEVVHLKPMITYYEESSQDIEQVLQIFIRMNSGGTFLSYSDLLLSIAVAQWNHLDARKEIQELVDDLNSIGRGFNFSKDFVLKAGLMLCDVNVGFRVDNFNRANMDMLEARWPDVKQALLLTVNLIDRFGFSRENLSAANALLPIAYHLYLYRSGHGDSFLMRSSYHQDREAIRFWLIRSLLKQGTWTSGVDGVLMDLRQAISKNGSVDFPIDSVMRVMARRDKPLAFTDEQIEDLADMRFADRRVFLLLSLLFPFLNLEHHFHVDHIFPRARFSENDLKAAGIPEEDYQAFREMMDGLPNLQLLEGSKNTEKQAMLPSDWLKHTGTDLETRQAYIDRHLLGALPAGLHEFKEFYEARLKRLEDRIRDVLGVDRAPSS